MAQKVGVAYEKVAKSASRIEPAFPWGPQWDNDGLKLGSMSAVSASRNSIVVDNFGNRYANEHNITDVTKPYRYQFYKEAVKYDMINMSYPRVPSWAIFDEVRREASPLVSMGTNNVGYDLLPWTADNMDAIERGWVLKADTLDELAELIAQDPENSNQMTAEVLKAQVERFNEFCANEHDDDFERTLTTMGPILEPPFYAMKLYPGGPNTKGGIKADVKRRALDWDNKPVPRLYTAGEISSVFKFVYQAGGNLTECIVCGRLAGKNAALETPWA
jgi:hypothetical protein